MMSFNMKKKTLQTLVKNILDDFSILVILTMSQLKIEI